MASTSTQSSSSSSSIGYGQSSTMIDNVVFANGFEDFIDGTSICSEKDLSPGVINPAFVA
ncbi:hypothetical protein CK203_013075 [Vitis vinifera]|uniref:Uncharacterized protein n=1 Tax=Vitis vinifera TaxID=29760 RepID=A0A438JLX9_VITVI|nr:hypothetical protein CK203_013075 [Vitis vinifera]